MFATLVLFAVLAQDPLDASTERDLRFILKMSPVASARESLPPSPTNRYADDPKAAALGKELFFDRGLSSNGRQACASCHDPAHAWTDARPRALGIVEGAKNTPTLLNVARQSWFFWDGRADSLWAQALGPIENTFEMASSRTAVLHHVAADSGLRARFEAVFGAFPDLSDARRFPSDALPGPVDPSHPFERASSSDPRHVAWNAMSTADRELVDDAFAKLGKAIEAFERTIVSGESDFDRFVSGLRTGDEAMIRSLTAAATRGLKLFVDKGSCVSCHFGPNLSDGQFHNLGYEMAEGRAFDEGRTAGVRSVRIDPFNGRGAHSDDADWTANQKLLYLVANEHVDGAYKTPSLRNVALTAPYGHDGRFATLAEVLHFYSELPGRPPIGHREETLVPVHFTEDEAEDLVAFLRSLSGDPRAPDIAAARGAGGASTSR